MQNARVLNQEILINPDLYHPCSGVSLPHGAMGWSVVWDSGDSWSYLLVFYTYAYKTYEPAINKTISQNTFKMFYDNIFLK